MKQVISETKFLVLQCISHAYNSSQKLDIQLKGQYSSFTCHNVCLY